jgi:hypothetical protein
MLTSFRTSLVLRHISAARKVVALKQAVLANSRIVFLSSQHG